MSTELSHDEITSMDQVNLDDYPDFIPISYGSKKIKSKDILGKEIYIYREKEEKDVITKEMKDSRLELKGAEGGKAKLIPVFRNIDTDPCL